MHNGRKSWQYLFDLVRMVDGHPDPVVETASLGSVELLDIIYQLSIPQGKNPIEYFICLTIRKTLLHFSASQYNSNG